MVVRILFTILLLAPLRAAKSEDLPALFYSQRVNNNSPFIGQQVLYTL